MLDKDKQLTFQPGPGVEFEIVSFKQEEFSFGSKWVVRVKPIHGRDYFLPAAGLVKKLAEAGVSTGDKVFIEKVAPDDKYKYGYFNVDVVSKGAPIADSPVGAGFAQKDDKTHKSMENFEKQFNKIGLDSHEVSIRLENMAKQIGELESKVSDILKEMKVIKSAKKGADLPF